MLFRSIAAILGKIVESGRLPKELDLGRFTVEPPRDPSHGDLATNAAMVYAKEAKAHFPNPRQLATEIAFVLAEGQGVDNAEVAGPGFINIRLKPLVFAHVVRDALAHGENFGKPPHRREGRINIEYVSANPTGPMHIGHCRGAVVGDALANLLTKAGFDVTKE